MNWTAHSKIYKVILKTTFVHVSGYPDHYEQNIVSQSPPFDSRFWTRSFPLVMQSWKACIPFANQTQKRGPGLKTQRRIDNDFDLNFLIAWSWTLPLIRSSIRIVFVQYLFITPLWPNGLIQNGYTKLKNIDYVIGERPLALSLGSIQIARTVVTRSYHCIKIARKFLSTLSRLVKRCQLPTRSVHIMQYIKNNYYQTSSNISTINSFLINWFYYGLRLRQTETNELHQKWTTHIKSHSEDKIFDLG